MKTLVKRLVGKFGRLALESAWEELRLGQPPHSQELQVLLQQTFKRLVREGPGDLPTFDEVGFRCYSQFEEDGILLYIFSIIGSTNKVSVELCAGDGTQCNTANLIINHGWSGFLFDGDPGNVERGARFFARCEDTFLFPPRFDCAWITAENVNDLTRGAGIEGEVDLLSLDVDGMEYWIWKALDCIQPRVVVCETHNVIGPDKALTVPYDPQFKVRTPDYHGASLAAVSKLAQSKGYRLVGTHRYGFNAFFVREGVGEGLLPAVSISSCLRHPYAKQAVRTRWPKVKDLGWQEV